MNEKQLILQAVAKVFGLTAEQVMRKRGTLIRQEARQVLILMLYGAGFNFLRIAGFLDITTKCAWSIYGTALRKRDISCRFSQLLTKAATEYELLRMAAEMQ